MKLKQPTLKKNLYAKVRYSPQPKLWLRFFKFTHNPTPLASVNLKKICACFRRSRAFVAYKFYFFAFVPFFPFCQYILLILKPNCYEKIRKH